MKKIVKIICVSIACVLLYKVVSFGVDKIISIGKEAKQKTEMSLKEDVPASTEVVPEVKSEVEPEIKHEEKKKTFKERLNAPSEKFALTNDYFKLYKDENTLKNIKLDAICRNENSYLNKLIYLNDIEVMATKELEDEGELLTCIQKSTNTALYLVYDYSQLKNKYMVGDKISTVGKVRNVKNVKGEYVPTIDTEYVFMLKDSDHLINIYTRIGTDKYEVGYLKDEYKKVMYEVYDIATQTKLNDTIMIQFDKDYYWSDINWTVGDTIMKPM